MNSIKLCIYFGSYFLFPYILWISYKALNKEPVHKVAYIILVIGLILGYARFIEPKTLLIKKHSIDLRDHNGKDSSRTIRIALISDTHWGLFKNGISANKLVEKLNLIKPDATLVAGDLLYELKAEKIKEVISPFKKLNHPIFAVTGNHDEERPGPPYGDKLISALREYGVEVINNEITSFNEEIQFVGLSDLWASKFKLDIMNKIKESKKTILLTHNPDMAYELKPNLSINLILAGHTHGGQIRIPFLYKKAIPTTHEFDYGLYKNKNTYKVFVSSGVGMVGLPFRFLIPPRIDLLKVYY